MKQISSQEVSIVVQGPVHPRYTKRCLVSLRKAFPDAELILSTWYGERTKGLVYDLLVLNEDPGAVCMDTEQQIPYNLNRMLVSTQNGVLKARRKYIFKCRSDLHIQSDNILRYWGRFGHRDHVYQITTEKIVIGSLFSLKYELGDYGEHYDTPFHISDFYCFGLAEDIRLLYDVPKVELEYFARYFIYHSKPREYPISSYCNRLWRFPPEQYLGLQLFKRKIKDIDFPNCLDTGKVSNELSERLIVNNFIILDSRQSKIWPQKFPFCLWARLVLCPARVWDGLYRHYVYLQDYKKYCNPHIKLPDIDVELKLRPYFQWYHWGKELLKYCLKVYRHILRSHDEG